MDIETINELAQEERAYHKWENEQKKKILSMHSQERKREMWRKFFNVTKAQDDSYLSGNVF